MTSIIPDVPSGGKRPGAGRPPAKPGVKRDATFSVVTTKENRERFKAAGGSSWAERVLLEALDSQPTDAEGGEG